MLNNNKRCRRKMNFSRALRTVSTYSRPIRRHLLVLVRLVATRRTSKVSRIRRKEKSSSSKMRVVVSRICRVRTKLSNAPSSDLRIKSKQPQRKLRVRSHKFKVRHRLQHILNSSNLYSNNNSKLSKSNSSNTNSSTSF